jgi:hypothetical protein
VVEQGGFPLGLRHQQEKQISHRIKIKDATVRVVSLDDVEYLTEDEEHEDRTIVEYALEVIQREAVNGLRNNPIEAELQQGVDYAGINLLFEGGIDDDVIENPIVTLAELQQQWVNYEGINPLLEEDIGDEDQERDSQTMGEHLAEPSELVVLAGVSLLEKRSLSHPTTPVERMMQVHNNNNNNNNIFFPASLVAVSESGALLPGKFHSLTQLNMGLIPSGEPGMKNYNPKQNHNHNPIWIAESKGETKNYAAIKQHIIKVSGKHKHSGSVGHFLLKDTIKFYVDDNRELPSTKNPVVRRRRQSSNLSTLPHYLDYQAL